MVRHRHDRAFDSASYPEPQMVRCAVSGQIQCLSDRHDRDQHAAFSVDRADGALRHVDERPRGAVPLWHAARVVCAAIPPCAVLLVVRVDGRSSRTAHSDHDGAVEQKGQNDPCGSLHGSRRRRSLAVYQKRHHGLYVLPRTVCVLRLRQIRRSRFRGKSCDTDRVCCFRSMRRVADESDRNKGEEDRKDPAAHRLPCRRFADWFGFIAVCR